MKRPTLLSPLAAVPCAEPWPWRIAVFVGYLLLGVIFTWPLSLHLHTAVIQVGDTPIDAAQNIWNLWWVRMALLNGANPYLTTYLFYPDSVNLFLQPLSLPNALLVWPILWRLGPLVAFNSVILLSFGFGGYWAYRVARALAIGRGAALLAGFIFVFTPYHSQQVWGGTMERAATFWLALYLLTLLNALARRSALSIVAAGCVLFLTTLASQYHGLYAALYTIAHGSLAACIAQRDVRWPTFGAAAGVGLVWLALLLPVTLLAGGLGSVALEDWYVRQVFHSVALVDLVAPNVFHPLWGDAARAWQGQLHPFGTETGAGMGLGVLLLCGLALWRRWAAAWPWALLALFCLVMAMGPQLRLTAAESPVPGPFMLLNLSDIFRNSSRPAIFVALFVLPMAMLAALGLDRGEAGTRGREDAKTRRVENGDAGTRGREDAKTRRVENGDAGTRGREDAKTPPASRILASRLSPLASRLTASHLSPLASRLTASPILASLITALVICESLVAPWKLLPLAVAPEINALNGDPVAGAVLELPPQLNDSRGLLNQICHGRPLMGGYLARLPFYASVGYPSVAQGLWRATAPGAELMPLDAASELASRGVRFVVVNHSLLPRSEHAHLRAWLDVPGINVVHTGDGREIYAIDPAAARPVITLGRGWYDYETDGERAWRWMQEEAEINLLTREQALVSLQLQVTAYGSARPLELWANGQRLDRVIIPGAPYDERITLRLMLAPGQTTLTLNSPAAVSPEGRILSLAVSALELQPLPSDPAWAAEAALTLPVTLPGLPMAPCDASGE
ncbi:MAG: hypothetical protein EI684_12555 [Candidatus Viridilinea halotolerans]|uniref:Membrane protein 6-pyruvoyl-tetrahydropterin synthase-related domain-containing protein n=1 Tax=Candidatus Viridilinea halotolerans TaxID=2491704 RepID=A0A426TYH0_9CHLR|nr:MAG: hypothetical protein EI684_12555 [Candidatus Viridilinea halotolerans]